MRKALPMVLAALLSVVAVAEGTVAAVAPVVSPAATVTAVTPTVLGLSVTTNVILTGTGFVVGTTFSSSEPSFVINTATVDSSTQVTLNVTTPPTPMAVTLGATPPGGVAENIAMLVVRGSEGTFFPVTPVRAADTRIPIAGQGVVKLGQGQYRHFAVVAIGEVPAFNVAAVVLNVTVTQPTAPSYFTVFPLGSPIPVVSNLNFTPGQTIPNHVTVGVGDFGRVAVYNDRGEAHVIIDVVGYYVNASGPTGAGYVPRLGIPRVADTRVGNPIGAIGPFGTISIQFSNAAARGIVAAVYNVTVDQPTADGFLTVYPAGSPRPNASSVNFVAGQPSPNLVTVKLGTNGVISIYNGSPGTIHLILDGVGLYLTSHDEPSYIVRPVPTGPFRLWDSRIDVGHPLTEHETFRVSGARLPATTVGVFANATVTAPSVGGYATVFPGTLAKPPSSSLNFTTNETRANQVIPAPLLDATNDISIYNDAGTAHYIIDIFAYLQAY